MRVPGLDLAGASLLLQPWKLQPSSGPTPRDFLLRFALSAILRPELHERVGAGSGQADEQVRPA